MQIKRTSLRTYSVKQGLMKTRLILFIRMYVYWLLFFVLQKPLFMVWQYPLLGDVRMIDWLLVPWHGLPLDLSMASYVMLAVGLILCVSWWVRWNKLHYALDGITGICLFVGLWTVLGDNGCFPSWGYHLDRDIFSYLASPKEALACAPWWVWVLGGVGFVVLFALWWFVYKRITKAYSATEVYEPLWSRRSGWTLVMLLLTGALFLPIRGSVTVSTMNSGRVYYSDNQMLNLAAVNPLFNVVESLGSGNFDASEYTYMSTEDAKQEVMKWLPSDRFDRESESLLTTKRPNVVLVILESFSMNAWQAMPRLQQLSKEGLFFSNIYANSYRTDRGVVSVLSGYPGQPTTSLMVAPYKSQSLPQLGQCLKKEGYELKFYYGGDEDFTNMRSYLVQGGFEDRVADRDFPASARVSKWGAPDHLLMDYAAKDILKKYDEHPEQKRLSTVLSLSSHEPFEVDYHHREHPYLNAIAYTDSCLGAFVDSLKQSSMWDSTLIVMVADHGYPYPQDLQSYMPARYRIPIVMAGGAVRCPKQIDRLGSQIDLVPTLLCQMGLDADDFVFGKNIVDTVQHEFAFFAYNDGFGLIVPNDTVVVDAKANKTMIGNNKELEYSARAFVQRVMETINEW